MKKGTLVLLAVLGLATVMLSFLLGSAGGMLTAMWQQQKNAQTKFEMLKAASVSDIAEQCTESVVNITVTARVKNYTGGSDVSETLSGHGTGVIIREDGYIVTCWHVIDNADEISVTLADGRELEAELVGGDEAFDLAVISVNDGELPAADIGDSESARQGEQVVIIGNPLGEFGSSVSAGILSAAEREITIEDVPLRLMQTDAAVNPGNSGGGLFNMSGELIGIVNAKVAASGIEGIGFAIPVNTIWDKVEMLLDSGEIAEKAYLGVSTRNVQPMVNGSKRDCIEIRSVREDSPAEKAGLREGDILLSANGKTLADNDDLTLAVKYCRPGDELKLEVYRNGDIIEITVELEAVGN